MVYGAVGTRGARGSASALRPAPGSRAGQWPNRDMWYARVSLRVPVEGTLVCGFEGKPARKPHGGFPLKRTRTRMSQNRGTPTKMFGFLGSFQTRPEKSIPMTP